MALTQAQEISFVFKKLLGVAETNTNKQFFEEPFQSSILITPNMIWYDAGQIPFPAPTITPVSQIDPQTGLPLVYGDSGVVRYYLWAPLLAVPGSPNAFSHPCLCNCIPFNFDASGSYVYRLRNYNNFDIAFGVQDWIVDPVAGTLTFYGSNLSSIGVSAAHPPLMTYYRYIGRLGIPGGGSDTGGEGSLDLPIIDDNILLQSATNPLVTAQLVVEGSSSGNSVYRLPVMTGKHGELVADITLNEIIDAIGVVDGGAS
jgi:hypothetical protein